MKCCSIIALVVAVMSILPAQAACDPFRDQAPFPLGSLGGKAQQQEESSALQVVEVAAGGPGALAGLKVDDFIYGVNGERLPLAGQAHSDGWRGAVTEFAYALERAESTNGLLSLQILRPEVGPMTVTATLPITTAWRPSFPVGDVRMQAYFEKVCADIHTKVQSATFFDAVVGTGRGGYSDYYGPFYGMILMAHPDWISTTGPRPYRLSINKIKTQSVAYLNSRILVPVASGQPGYVDGGFDNWALTAHAMFLGEYRRKYGDAAVDADIQRSALLVVNRLLDANGYTAMHGGVTPENGYSGGGLNIINAHAALALGILKGAGANFAAASSTVGLTIDAKFLGNWNRLKLSMNSYNGADVYSLNEDGNIGYGTGWQSGRAIDGCPGGFDSNARTPCAAAGYQIYRLAGGTAATADDLTKLSKMMAFTPRNWQRQFHNHGYSAAGTVFSQMLLPFLGNREQSYFRENSRCFFTLSRDHAGAVQYMPGRNNLLGDGQMGYQNMAYLMPGMAWAVGTGNLPSFPAGTTSRVFAVMKSPRNDWPQLAARRVKVVGLTQALDMDLTDYQGVPLSTYGVVWSKVSGGTVNFSSTTTLDTTVTFAAAGNYRLHFTGSNGIETVQEDYDFEVATTAPPVPNDTASIVRQPISRTCAPGYATSFSTIVAGNGPFVYQWKLNGVDHWGPSTSSLLTLSNPSAAAFGTYQCTIYYPGGQLVTNPVILCPAGKFVVGTGGLKRELWVGLGTSMAEFTSSSRYPFQPDITGMVPTAEAPIEQGENYGQRLSGWVVAPTTGVYKFFLACDNAGQLWLSTNESAEKKVKIAEIPAFTTYRKYSEGASVAVNLVAGQRYYIEALHVEGGFADFLSVAWQKPGDPVPADGSDPIPGNFLQAEQFIPDLGYEGLVSHWKLDEGTGTVAADSFATGNEGTIVGPTWTTGKLGGALHFDGINDKVTCTTAGALGGKVPFTVAAWVKLDAGYNAPGVIIQQRPTDGLNPPNSDSGQYQLLVDATARVVFQCSGQSSEAFNFSGSKALNDGQWHHVAGVRGANGDGRIYVDGALDGSVSSSGFIWDLDPTNNVGIGADTSDNALYFKGNIDDVRIYQLALTESRLRTLALVPGINAGWKTSAWTGDASTGISTATSWAYHFGDVAATNANTSIYGCTVTGLVGANPSVQSRFSISGTTTFLADTNNLTALTGQGSAVVGADFVYSGFPTTITLDWLTPGRNYVVTFLTVGWEAAGLRQLTFTSGGQSFTTDQNQFGINGGLRVDYCFTADAKTRVITVAPTAANPANSFHIYGLALRDEGPPASVTTNVAAWTNDDSTGNGPGSKWAYHFGNTVSPSVAGRVVTGLGSTTQSAGEFTITGASSISTNDVNTLTAAGGTGSATLAKDFLYGGNPAVVTLQGLVAGRKYVTTFLSVGWEAAGGRQVVFTSGADSWVMDQDQYGNNNGIRMDYAFTADATTRAINIAPHVSTPANTFHIYGLALRQGSIVENTCDSGPGSLRQALMDAAATAGADTITFAPGLSGQTILLASELVINDSGGVTIDAASLPGGLVIDGAGARRLLQVATGTTVNLKRLQLINGRAVGVFPNSYGGGILTQGNLSLVECSISNCLAGTAGGALAVIGTVNVTLDGCTFHHNTAQYGGGVQNEGTLTATNSTIAFNLATLQGGAISAPFGHVVNLTHCTLSGNVANGGGGGIQGTGANIGQSVVSGNTAPTNANLSDSIGIAAPNVINSPNILLAGLGDYGGHTQTMPPLPGSPVINGLSSSPTTRDQRGFLRDATPDIGAAEFLGKPDLSAYWMDDWDGDGVPFGVEYALGTNPFVPDANGAASLQLVHNSNGDTILTFGFDASASPNVAYVLKSSLDLITWSPVYRYQNGATTRTGNTTASLTGNLFSITNRIAGPKVFYRFESELLP